ncbi:putative AP2-like ethylene-responsive transcription factor [Rosa chinensis]|uniref:Putative AP2-like ethylene-responsive transcription factor n=1 Tax=Rosa chinensis TaxID=74649 RepID=A0A2P6RBR7_ROSCH|nr:putative AP2-like ethylene-responsive transcription factor [Rosa chinensis]
MNKDVSTLALFDFVAALSSTIAAFMCGREPNFELLEEEKQELMKFKWDEFLAMTHHSINNKS